MSREFNVNNYVYVKLTDLGRTELKRQHDKLEQMFPKIGPHRPKEEVDGWSKWQLWDLMHTLGGKMGLGFIDVPFETTIRIGDNHE